MHLADDRSETGDPPREVGRPVGQLLERQRPAVDGVGDELLHDPERGAQRRAVVRPPAGEAGHVLEGVVGEEPEHLQLGVHPCLEPPVGLHDQLLVDDHRRVRLLEVDRPHRVERGRLGGQRVRAAEVERAVAGGERAVAAHQMEQLSDERRIGQRLVDGHTFRRVDRGPGPVPSVVPRKTW